MGLNSEVFALFSVEGGVNRMIACRSRCVPGFLIGLVMLISVPGVVSHYIWLKVAVGIFNWVVRVYCFLGR